MSETDWSHHEPVKIRFGAGSLNGLAEHVPAGKLLFVTTPGMTRRGVTERVEGLLEGKELVRFDEVGPNPTLRAVEKARHRLRGENIEGLVAVGGGSVLDTAKALSLLLVPANQDIPLATHLLEKRPLAQMRPLPLCAVATTAGTGSEVTPFGTLWDDEGKRKQSITSPHLHPETALLDPELTLELPRDVTLPSSLDALSHAMESVWNHNANPLTLLYARHAVRLILDHLPRVLEHPESLPERSRMLEGSLLAGLAIATTRTALAHSISYPLTAHYGLTHGYACSFTLPALLRYNAGDDDGRLTTLSKAVGYAGPEELARAIETLYAETGAVDTVKKVVHDKQRLLAHLDEMFTPERAGNNLRTPDTDAVRKILVESAEKVLDL